MQFPDFDPQIQMLVMANDKIEVVKETSEDKRIESNMKVTEFVSQHFKDFDLHCNGFKNLICSNQIKFEKGDFSKNSDFVIEVLKVAKTTKLYSSPSSSCFISHFKMDHKVMLEAVKNCYYTIFDCEELVKDPTFLKKLLKDQPNKLFKAIELRARSYDPIIEQKILQDKKDKNIDREREKEIKMGMIDCFVSGKFSKDEAKFFMENVFNDFSDEELDTFFKEISNDQEIQNMQELCKEDVKMEIVKAQEGMGALLFAFVQFLNELNSLLEIRKIESKSN